MRVLLHRPLAAWGGQGGISDPLLYGGTGSEFVLYFRCQLVQSKTFQS